MVTPAIPIWELVLRSAAIYLVLVAALRLFGKRELGQFTIYDLVLILLVTNALQPAMTGPDNSLAGGLVIIATLLVLNKTVAELGQRFGFFHRLITPEPTVIIRSGAYLEDALRRVGVDRDECEMAIREHGLADVSDVALGVLEPDGAISIVPTGTRVGRTRSRIRMRRA